MAYKRYFYKNGKKFGPYYYESYRDSDGKTKKRYIRLSPDSGDGAGNIITNRLFFYEKSLMLILVIFLIFLIVAILVFSQAFFKFTGRSILDVLSMDSQTHSVGSKLDGIISLQVEPGDLIPSQSLVKISLSKGGKTLASKQVNFSEFVENNLQPVEITQEMNVCNSIDQNICENVTVESEENVCVNISVSNTQEVCNEECSDYQDCQDITNPETGEVTQDCETKQRCENVCSNETSEEITQNCSLETISTTEENCTVPEEECSLQTITDYYYNETGNYSRNVSDFINYNFSQSGDYVLKISSSAGDIEKNIVVIGINNSLSPLEGLLQIENLEIMDGGLPISTIPIYVKPLNNGAIQPNTDFNYTFNFSLTEDCSNIVLSNSSTITTDSTGVGFISIPYSTNQISYYLCEYINDSLRKVHSFSDQVFNNVYASSGKFSNNVSADWFIGKINFSNIQDYPTSSDSWVGNYSFYYNKTESDFIYCYSNGTNSSGGNCISSNSLDSWANNYTDYYNKTQVDDNMTLRLFVTDQRYNESISINDVNDTINNNNASWSSTYNETYDSKVSDNVTWNQTFASTLYAGIEWGYNMTTPFTNWLSTFAYNYNQTAPAMAYTDSVVNANNASWLSIYNATYDSYGNKITSVNDTLNNNNASWSSIYNATYDAKAAYQFGSNNFNGSGNFTTTGNITSTSHGFFGWLGSITGRVIKIFANDLDINGTLQMNLGNITNASNVDSIKANFTNATIAGLNYYYNGSDYIIE